MSCFIDIENKPDDWLVLDPLTVQKPIPKTGCDTNLIVQNYLSEFKTDAQKQKVKDNLGLFVDNILSKNSNNPISNKVVYDEFNKLKSQVRLNTINWQDDSDINDYVKEGIYNIKGKKTRQDDNLPIINTGDINARLTVIATESDNNIVITQVLNLNNNAGGEGNVYIRSYQNGQWKVWGKLQTNVEVGVVNQEQLDALVDNGIYSGILSTTGETFVIICINNYAIAQQVGIQHISHLKYSLVAVTGEVKIEKRTRDAYGFWADWTDISNLAVDNEVTNTSVNPVQSQAIAKAIDEGEKRALRRLFVAAGAEYNDTNQIIQKTAPWGTDEKWVKNDDGTYTYWEEPAVVEHLPGYYYLNGLGDITEEQMIYIYNAGALKANIGGFYSKANIRTFLSSQISGQEGYSQFNLTGILSGASAVETAIFGVDSSLIKTHGIALIGTSMYAAFSNCSRLKYIQKIAVSGITNISGFNNCNELVYVELSKLKVSVSFAQSKKISKKSILAIITNAVPTSAITITLHPDAYARIANQSDIVAALEAQPLVTLVSA